jgi:1-aminocyclopropane-1-carboxylate deaminase
MSLKIFEKPGDTPIQFVDRFQGNIELYIKREDLIHPLVSGNKWRKLKYNLIEAHSRGYNKLVTFGGAFSNHILATAAAGAACGFETVGIIRGEIIQPLNPTLEQATDLGMKLVSVTREEYRRKSDPEFQEKLKQQVGDGYLIPEGGTNVMAGEGCAEITAGGGRCL